MYIINIIRRQFHSNSHSQSPRGMFSVDLVTSYNISLLSSVSSFFHVIYFESYWSVKKRISNILYIDVPQVCLLHLAIITVNKWDYGWLEAFISQHWNSFPKLQPLFSFKVVFVLFMQVCVWYYSHIGHSLFVCFFNPIYERLLCVLQQTRRGWEWLYNVGTVDASQTEPCSLSSKEKRSAKTAS